jgi:hypothetical protein
MIKEPFLMVYDDSIVIWLTSGTVVFAQREPFALDRDDSCFLWALVDSVFLGAVGFFVVKGDFGAFAIIVG